MTLAQNSPKQDAISLWHSPFKHMKINGYTYKEHSTK